MKWTGLQDAENPENKNAGNGGDLVKHTVYLTVITHLLDRPPWSKRLRVRECHAGRGMYSIPDSDRRRLLLKCLYEPVDSDIGVLLHDSQRAMQQALGVWPASSSCLTWYAGSAVMNACRLATAPGKHLIEFYEQSPCTRSVLREVLATLGHDASDVESRVLPHEDSSYPFDGEQHIMSNIDQWDSQDLVLLDPFSIWRNKKCHQDRRDRYGYIIDTVIAQGQKSPLLVLFWTWGRDFRGAEGDLQNTNCPVISNGYQDLRARLCDAGRHLISIVWKWQLQFAMWVLVPASQQRCLADALRQRCCEMRKHLSCSRDMNDVEVKLEGRGP